MTGKGIGDVQCNLLSNLNISSSSGIMPGLRGEVAVARRAAILAAAGALALAGCVQTRQVADVEFQPPQGSYSLIVMRPDVQVGSVTAGGMVEPR